MTPAPNCRVCGGSGIEEVYGGHGTVLEVPCSSCCQAPDPEPDPVVDDGADRRWHLGRVL